MNYNKIKPINNANINKLKEDNSIQIKEEESTLNNETKQKVDEYMAFFNVNNNNKNLKSTLNVIKQDIEYILDQIKYLKLQKFILNLKKPKDYEIKDNIIKQKILKLEKNLEKMLIDKKATLSKSLSNSKKYIEKKKIRNR